MKKNFDEAITSAEKKVTEMKALKRVYEQLLSSYRSEFCMMEVDEETGEYKTDDNGDFIYREKPDVNNWYYDYDEQMAIEAKKIYHKLFDALEKMC